MPPKRQNKNKVKGGKRTEMSSGGQRSLGSGGQPPELLMDLNYTSRIAVSITAGLIQRQTWSGNGPYDPDTTGVGDQPYNYDDFAILYQRYRVRACRIETNLRLNANGEGVMVLVPTSVPGAAFSTWRDAAAAPRSVTREFFTGLDILLQNPNGSLVREFSTKEILGESDGSLYQSDNNTVPTQEWFWNVHIESTSSSTITGILYTKLTYRVKWFEFLPRTIDLSAVTRGQRQPRDHSKNKLEQKDVRERESSTDNTYQVVEARTAGSGLPVITNSGTTQASTLRPAASRDVKVEKKSR